jgi:hypothetical protein
MGTTERCDELCRTTIGLVGVAVFAAFVGGVFFFLNTPLHSAALLGVTGVAALITYAAQKRMKGRPDYRFLLSLGLVGILTIPLTLWLGIMGYLFCLSTLAACYAQIVRGELQMPLE